MADTDTTRALADAIKYTRTKYVPGTPEKYPKTKLEGLTVLAAEALLAALASAPDAAVCHTSTAGNADAETRHNVADAAREAEALREALAREAELREALASIQALVDEQAEDEGLWMVYAMGEQRITEAYLQQELRRLHDAIERAALAAAAGDTSEEPS